MEQIVPLILESGRTAIDMALYLLMPVMVVMLALMKLLEAKGYWPLWRTDCHRC
ncbi:hypothetical protein [Aliamphritea spongicola]|nr:hypothetical protein [Aliamphritea spongicola]